jgi:hypothetical protein
MSDQTISPQTPNRPGKKSCFRLGYPEVVQFKEEDLIKARRDAAGAAMPRKEGSLLDSSIGLALSGGGIRSATFCLGVLQSLARVNMLREIDYLSTVSGGGYVGSFLGRWFSREKTLSQTTGAADRIEAALGDSQSPQVKWLREHGRYVTPTGGGDVLTAAAHVLRSWIALHFNLLPVIVGLFCLLGYVRTLMFDSDIWQNLERWAAPTSVTHIWWSPWFILPIAVALLACIPLGTAFWLSQALTRFREDKKFVICTSAAILLSIAAMVIQEFWPAKAIGGIGWSAILICVAATALIAPKFEDRGPYALAMVMTILLIYLGLQWSQPAMVMAAATPLLSLFYYRATLARAHADVKAKSQFPSHGAAYETEVRTKTRILLTALLGSWLLWFAIALGIAVIDTLGQKIWLGSHHTSLAAGSASVFAIAVSILHKFADKLLGAKEKGGQTRSLRALVVPTLAVLLGTAYLTTCAWLAQICLWGLPNKVDLTEMAASQSWRTPSAARVGIPFGREEALVYPRTFPDSYFKAPESILRDKNDHVVMRDINEEKYLWVRPRGWRPRAILGLCVVIIWALRKNLTFLNLSSYHQLYSARLTRAYLGATNPTRLETEEGLRISDPIPGDDCLMQEYAPHQAGGPLHLINVTINETVSGKSQVEQRDRKGLPMAIGPATVTVGMRYTAWAKFEEEKFLIEPLQMEADKEERSGRQPKSANYHVFGIHGVRQAENLRLSNWVGISGAAFSTGAGAHTTLSLSILTGLANVRLGYWWDSGVAWWQRENVEPMTIPKYVKGVIKSARAGAGGADTRHWKIGEVTETFPLLAHLTDEVTGQFRGPSRRNWYLSDGGHFENTGCYELLRRRLPLMIVCDCGADPDYRFEDLANLVRKARIDFDTEIEFLEGEKLSELLHDEKNPLPKLALESFGGLRSLYRKNVRGRGFPGEKYSNAHACLAKVRYAVSKPSPPGVIDSYHSLLLVIKPSLTGDEPVDLLQYHSENPEFPQEPTSDQFFDEAQWESYRRLGAEIGTALFDQTGIIERMLDAVATQRTKTPLPA